MRHLTKEEIEITERLSKEADTLTEEEKDELKKRLSEIEEEQTNVFSFL